MKLKKGERVMEVRTGIQASAFLNSGWSAIDNTDAEKDLLDDTKNIEKVEMDSETEISKMAAKRGRPAKTT